MGPFHHNSYSSNSYGKRPLEAQSAGLSVPLTCFHLSGGMSSTIDDTIANKRLKTSRTAGQPIEHNGAVSPSMDVLDGEVKDLFYMVEELSE